MPRRLTIAYLVRPAEGGIKTHMLALLAGLDRTRFEPVVICPPESSLYREAEQAGCRVIPITLVGELSLRHDIKAVLQLRCILREIKPDILHMHSAKAGLVGRLAVAALLRRPGTALTFHSFVFDERINRRKRALVSWIERRLCRYADKIITVSNALRNEVVMDMRLPTEKLTVIYNGIPFCHVIDMAKTSKSSVPLVGTVSRLAPQKGVEYLIRAAAIVREKFPAARFIIIGDGPFREELENLARKIGVRDSIDFLGFQPDALSIVATFDVFALTSTRETFGLTLVEALSQGVPVVASGVGGIPEIVDGSTTGLLAEPGNLQDIASKICLLLKDKELAERIGRQGSEYVRAHFSAERMVRETENLYLGLLPNVAKDA